MALRLPRLKVFWNEMVMWTAYTERVITVIQRAWRYYLARKAVVGAAKISMISRLRCAKMVGKMSGFIKTRDIQQSVMTPPANSETRATFYIESEDITPPKKRVKVAIPRGIYMIQDE